METFVSFIDAQKAASIFFKKHFSHSGHVGVEKKRFFKSGSVNFTQIEFYSCDDPAMDDTFLCNVMGINSSNAIDA